MRLLVLAMVAWATLPSLAADGVPLLPAADSTLVPTWSFKQDASVRGLSWSPDSRLLAVSSRNTVRLYRFPGFTKEDIIESNQGEIAALAWSPDAGSLAVGGQDGTIWVWTPTEFSKKLDQRAWVFDLQWSSNGDSLIGVDLGSFAKIWDLSGFARATIQLDGQGLSISISPDNQSFAVGTGNAGSSLSVFATDTFVLRWKRQDIPATYRAPFGYGKDEVNGVSYSPDGKYLASVHQDGRLIVRSASTGETVLIVQAHEPGLGGARGVSWSADSQDLATCGEDGRVNLVHFLKPRNRLELLDSDKAVWAVAFSPDGKWIAAGTDDGSLFIWSTPAEEKIAEAKPATKKSVRRQRRHPATRSHRRPTGWHFVPHWPFFQR
jgi:WD40 repeat protein